MRKLLATMCLLLAWVPAPGAGAAELGKGPLPLRIEPGAPLRLDARDEVRIEGTIEDAAQVTLIVRIDDGKTTDYASRVNREHALPAGPFSLSIPLAGLATSGGRKLDAGDIRRIVVFTWPEQGRITVTRLEAVRVAEARPATAAGILDLGKGMLPLTHEPGGPLRFADEDEIRFEGTVEGAGKVAVVLRIDDGRSFNYASRFNEERTLSPGPFRISAGLKGLRTPDGRTLDHRDIRRIVLFVWQGEGRVSVGRFEAGPAPKLPPGVEGYSLGAADARLLAGFERIAPGDARLAGRDMSVVRRPAPDPLVANGIKGVEWLRLPAPPGRARVTVWSEDPGEWETLFHPLSRRITINGQPLLSVDQTPRQWLGDRYLAGFAREHGPADDAWTAYGRWRGNPRSVEVPVGTEGILIGLAGAEPNALFLSAVMVEPAGSARGFEHVQGLRAQWYRTTWPIGPPVATDAEDVPVAEVDSSLATASANAPLAAAAAPGTGVRLGLSVQTDRPVVAPRLRIEPPRLGAGALQVRAWAGQRRLERRYAGDTALAFGDNRLVAATGTLPLRPGEPRTYELWVDVPPDAKPGRYRGRLQIDGPDRPLVRQAIEIDVPDVVLPPPAKPAGFYLAAPPHLAWFPALAAERDRQVACDLAFLRGFGFTGSAPAVTVPSGNGRRAFLTDMRRAFEAQLQPGWLIYNPADTLLASEGLAGSARSIALADAVMRAAGLPAPVWSVADEPSNPGQAGGNLRRWIAAIRTAAPGIRLAGHLNARADEPLVTLFDTVLVNPGFGIDADMLARTVALDRSVWLYNTEAPRLTAGHWLWSTTASRYVQWHGRMPTADPADPTDGREGDVQMLYPSMEVCPALPDIHRDLLRMAEGLVDQRWLLWLGAQTTPEARRLTERLRNRSGGRWSNAKGLTRAELENDRKAIISLLQKR
jgi:hypothetical protein